MQPVETSPPRQPPQERGLSPLLPHHQQQQQQENSVLPAALHAESPLLSLAAGELPSFSLPASPEAARSPARSMQDGGPAGIESNSAANAAVPATGAWVESLRPPEQRILGEYSEWDGSLPGSPARRGISSSRPASPERPCGASSRPTSPKCQRSCSSPAMRERHRGDSSRGNSPDEKRKSLPQNFRRYGSHASSDDALQQEHAPAPPPPQASPPLPHSEANEQPEMGSPASPQQCDSPLAQPPAAAASRGAGPLTAMVNRAVGRLQQLQELQQLVGDVDVRGSGTADGRAVACSLEPRLGGAEAVEGLAGTCCSPNAAREAEASGRQAAPSVCEALRCRRLQATAEGPASRMPLPSGGDGGGGELARLQLLQQQLEASMAEVRGRLVGWWL